jgi:dihydrolipoamide dehydrogenase
MKEEKFDVVVLGGGPGGYVAAIRAAQLGKSVALVEREHLGGVCLNKGCIPTKALLKGAERVHQIKEMKDFGIQVDLKNIDAKVAVKRAKQISNRISKGVAFLMKKNNIKVYSGMGKLEGTHCVQVALDDKKGMELLRADNIILATGAHYRTFPGLEHDGKNIIGAWEAVFLDKLPKKMGIIGAGAIGVEFAYFWNAYGVDVHIFELQDHLLPLEDEDSSLEIEKAYKKYGIKYSLGLSKVETKAKGSDAVEIKVEGKDGKSETHQFDKVLLAVGMTGNVENLGLENIGIEVERGFIKVNDYMQTNLPHIYAIGDVNGAPLLAHAASHEGVLAAEHLAGEKVHTIKKENIPGCTYCLPQVASIGLTEKKAKEQGLEYKVGKLPFMANGKAVASNEKDGFVKVLMGKHGELLGAHIVGNEATELIHEYSLFKTMEGVDEEIFATVHPHPTLGEWLSEAVMNAQGRSLNF